MTQENNKQTGDTMRQIIKKSFLLLILSGFAVSITAQPQQGRKAMQNQDKQWAQNARGQEKGRDMRLPNLSDEQKEQIKEIKLSGQKEALPIKNLLGEKKAKLRTLTTSETYNQKSVNSTIDEISGLEASLMKLRENHRQQVREVLTEEQRIVFDTQGQRGPRGKQGNLKRGKR